MLVYLSNIIFIFPVLMFTRKYLYYSKINYIKNKCKKKELLIARVFILYTFISMVLVAGLRYNVGTDYIEYENIFYIIKDRNIFEVNIEFIFSMICKTISLISHNSVWMFIAVAIFIYYFVYKLAIEKTNYYELAIFLFIAFGFYTSTFNIMRQWMACVVGLYALTSIKQFTQKKIWILILISILCHKTAIILIPIYFFVRKERKNSTRVTFMLVSTILYFFPNEIMKFIENIVSNISVLSKYSKYIVDYEIYQGTAFIFPTFCLIVYILYLLYRKKLKLVDENTEIYINILTVGYGISAIGQKLMAFNRIQFFFIPIITIIIPQIIYSMRTKDKKIAYPICIIMGIIFMVYSLKQNGGQPLPYISVFSKIL